MQGLKAGRVHLWEVNQRRRGMDKEQVIFIVCASALFAFKFMCV